jgi:transcriptional regulator with XRE-family HTH domain
VYKVTPKEQAIALLAQGLSTSQVAAACGVSDSYISQLKAEPEVQEQIQAAMASATMVDMAFDNRLENAESLALERIEKSLSFANMGQALSAFRILNGARKRKDESLSPSAQVTVNVSLTLPAAASARYVINNQNEIVEVEGKTMATATPKSLDLLLASRATAVTHDTAKQLASSSLNRAANRLDSVQSMSPRPPRRLPSVLSADIL